MRNKTLYLLFVLFLFSCESNAILDPKNQAATYFPLAPGNSWTYSGWNGTEQTITYRIIEQKLIGSQVYFSFGVSAEHTEWIRIAGGSVYKLINGREVLWLDFTKNDGANYYYNPTPYSGRWKVHVQRDRTVEYDIGQKYKYLDCVDFFFDLPHAVDEEQGFAFAPGVGIVNFYGTWVNLFLKSYSISPD